jgi:hypothetical protein
MRVSGLREKMHPHRAVMFPVRSAAGRKRSLIRSLRKNKREDLQ